MERLASEEGSRRRRMTELRTILVPADSLGLANEAFRYAGALVRFVDKLGHCWM